MPPRKEWPSPFKRKLGYLPYRSLRLTEIGCRHYCSAFLIFCFKSSLLLSSFNVGGAFCYPHRPSEQSEQKTWSQTVSSLLPARHVPSFPSRIRRGSIFPLYSFYCPSTFINFWRTLFLHWLCFPSFLSLLVCFFVLFLHHTLPRRPT